MGYNSARPYLTLDDKIAASYLGSVAPAFVVEGDTDVLLYAGVLRRCHVDWFQVDIVIGEDKTKILSFLARKEIPFDVVAVVDRDHDGILGKLVADKRLYYTHYYSVESYLALQKVVKGLLEQWASPREVVDATVNDALQRTFRLLEPMGAVVWLKLRQGWPVPLEGTGLERWYHTSPRTPDVPTLLHYMRDELHKREFRVDEDQLNAEYERALRKWQCLPVPDRMRYLCCGSRSLATSVSGSLAGRQSL